MPSPSFARDDAGIPRGRPPRNKGVRYPADPPTIEEIIVRPATALTAAGCAA